MMSKMIQAVIDLKTFAMKWILKYPATYHAIDVVSKIVGWEEAAKKDKSVDLAQKVQEIYEEAVETSTSYREKKR